MLSFPLGVSGRSDWFFCDHVGRAAKVYLPNWGSLLVGEPLAWLFHFWPLYRLFIFLYSRVVR